jgi:phosphatidylserine decarboxylase precursor-related protein
MKIVKDTWKFVLPLLVLAVILFFFWKIGSLFLLGLASLTLFFSRDPDRKVPQGEDLILSPADGKVIDISEVGEKNFLHSRVKAVRIFMSIFNVHVQRSPVKGRWDGLSITLAGSPLLIRERPLKETRVISLVYKRVTSQILMEGEFC